MDKNIALLAVVIAAAAFLTLSGPGAIGGAYDTSAWTVSYDPTSSSLECRNLDPEFELVVEQYTPGVTQLKTPIKTLCEGFVPSTSEYSDTFIFDESDVYSLWNGTIPFRAGCGVILPQVQVGGTPSYSAIPSKHYECRLTAPVQTNSVTGIYYTSPGRSVGLQPSEAIFINKNETFTVKYTIPREQIPSTIHYRAYSCPLPPGYQLVSDTFEAGELIIKPGGDLVGYLPSCGPAGCQSQPPDYGSFSYIPAFFCQRHPAIKVLTSTSTSSTDTQVYRNVVAGQTMTVPAGERWTLFYATKDTLSKQGYEANLQIIQLQGTTQQQAAIIANLTSLSGEQAEIINALNVSITQKAALIAQLQSENTAQAAMIDHLQLNLNEKVELIRALTTEIDKQAAIVNSLQINLQEKAALISQLQVTTADQARLISEMRLSFADQATIINALNNTVQDDAVLISQLSSSAGDQGQIIVNLRATIQEDAQIIQSLTQSNDEQAQIIAAMRLNSEQEQALIAELTKNNNEMAAQLAALVAAAKANQPLDPMLLFGGFVVLILVLVVRKAKR